MLHFSKCHSQLDWESSKPQRSKEIPANASKRKMCEIKLHGVPTAESELLVYIGEKSEAVEGGTLLDFDESCGVAKISVTFPLTAQKVVRIAF